MGFSEHGPMMQQLVELVPGPRLGDLSDRELVDRYVGHRDETAFATLLRRHGAMVLGVCQRVLRDPHLAEDAFQATFLVFVRKAATIGRRERLAGWLYGVAYRVALRARAEETERRRREAKAAIRLPVETSAEAAGREVLAVLDEELHGLPYRYRDLFRLCFVEGRTREEAARELNWSLRTLQRRLERGRALLHARLLRRGIAVSAAMAVLEASAGPTPGAPPALLAATAQTVAAYTAGDAVTIATTGGAAVALARRSLAAMELARWKIPASLMLAACVATAGAALLGRHLLTNSGAAATESDSDQIAHRAGARTDHYGDPLPRGALARIGSAHRQQGTQINGVTWSPDGTMLASAGGDGTLSVWDAATGKELRRFDSHDFSLVKLVFFPDGRTIAAQAPGKLHHWNVRTGKPAAPLEKGAAESPGCFALSPDGRILASSGGFSTPAQRSNNPIVLSSVATGRPLRTLEGHQSGIEALAFSGDGDTLASASQDNTIRVWDVRRGKQRYGLNVLPHEGQNPPWVCLAISPDSRVLAAGSWDKTIRLWELPTGKPLARLPWHTAEVLSVAFSPDSTKLASGAGDATLRIWDVRTGKELRVCRLGRYCRVEGVAFSPDGKRIVTGGSDQRVRLWDASTGTEIQPLPEAEHRLWGFALSRESRFAATWGADQTIRFWELSSGRQIGQLSAPARITGGPALSPDDKLVAGACEDHTIRVWDCGSGREVHRFNFSPRWGTAYSLRFSPDGKTLAACLEDQTIRFWSIDTGGVRQFCRLTGNATLFSMVFSPDGETVAASANDRQSFAGLDGAVYVWDRRTGRELRRVQRGQDGIGALAFSPDGHMLAVAGSCYREAGTMDRRTIRSADLGGALRIWDLGTGEELRRFPRQPIRGSSERRFVNSVAFAPDGKTLASGEEDGTVVIWEVATGQPRQEFSGHRASVTKVLFSRDGNLLVSSSIDHTALVWDVHHGTWDQQTPLVLSARDLDALWTDLGSQDVRAACQAMSALIAAPDQAVAFFATRLASLSEADGARIDQLIADLDSAAFARRETANQGLAKIAESAEPALRKALSDNSSLESRARIEALLRQAAPPSPARLQQLRALEVLEHINSVASRRLLQKLAGGARQGWLTREACDSYARLAVLPIEPGSGTNASSSALATQSPGRSAAASPLRTAAALNGDIVKEPDYESGAPRYCLAVFGPSAKTRVWLVLDGDVLYADRDGSGDLTVPGKAIQSSSGATATGPNGQIFSRTDNYNVGLVKAADSTGRRWTLKVGITRGGGELHHLSAEVDGKPEQRVMGDGIAFAAAAKDAPIVHFDGPLALGIMDGQRLTRGKINQFYALIGTPGKGDGTFAAYQGEVLPGGAPAVVAEFKFTSREPAKSPIIVKTMLRRVGAVPWMVGTVPVPADATGSAQVIMSISERNNIKVAPGAGNVPVVDAVVPDRKR